MCTESRYVWNIYYQRWPIVRGALQEDWELKKKLLPNGNRTRVNRRGHWRTCCLKRWQYIGGLFMKQIERTIGTMMSLRMIKRGGNCGNKKSWMIYSGIGRLRSLFVRWLLRNENSCRIMHDSGRRALFWELFFRWNELNNWIKLDEWVKISLELHWRLKMRERWVILEWYYDTRMILFG